MAVVKSVHTGSAVIVCEWHRAMSPNYIIDLMYNNDSWSAFQRELTILTTTIIIHVVHNYECCNTIPESISLSAPTIYVIIAKCRIFQRCNQRVSTIYRKT